MAIRPGPNRLAGCPPVNPRRSTGGLKGRYFLNHKPENNSSQNVSAPSRCKSGTEQGIDNAASVRGSHDRIGSLEKNSRAAARSGSQSPAALVARQIRKDPGKLALMRRENASRMRDPEQCTGIGGKNAHGVGVDHTGPIAVGTDRTHRLTQIFCIIHPGARADQNPPAARIPQMLVKGNRPFPGLKQRIGQQGAIHIRRRRRSNDGAHARARTIGAMRGHDSGPRHPPPAENNRVPARVFVVENRRRRKRVMPQGRIVLEGGMACLSQNAFRNANITKDRPRVIGQPRREKMPDFFPEKRHRAVCDHDRRIGRTGVAVHAAGYIHSDDGRVNGFDFFKQGGYGGWQGACKSGSEDGIHDKFARFRSDRIKRLNPALPQRRRPRRIVLEGLRRHQTGHADRPSTPGQIRRRDKSVSAIVSGSAQNQRPPRSPG